MALPRIVSAGNVAGEGAKIAALSQRERAEAHAIVHEVRYVELSGRTRAAAAAQMLLVGAVHGGVSTRECARGAWNVLAGVVQATVVQDLLEPAAVSVLVPPPAMALGLV